MRGKGKKFKPGENEREKEREGGGRGSNGNSCKEKVSLHSHHASYIQAGVFISLWIHHRLDPTDCSSDIRQHSCMAIIVLSHWVQSPCGRINIIMTLTFYPHPAVQHRFNTENLILLHLAYMHIWCSFIFYSAISSWIHCLPLLLDHFLLASSYTSSYIVLNTAVTKMHI